MFDLMTLDDVSEIIQIAIAPVFLIAGIAGMLGVLTNRLGRIIDRVRVLSRSEGRLTSSEELAIIAAEKRALQIRSNRINWAIGAATGGALAICLVIISLFIGNGLGHAFAVVVGGLFIVAMSLLAIALGFFLSEIWVAARSMRASMAPSEDHFHEKIQ